MSDLKQTLPSSTRALPFTNDPTTVQTITTTDDIVFTLDEAGAIDGTTVSLSILQNHPVDFPSSFAELAGSRQPVLGKMNYYLLTRTNGIYQFIRYQSIDDAVDSSDSVEVGKTQLSVGTADATTIALSWTTATNAIQYALKRYTTSDYSDVPVTVYTGNDLAFTDTGLTAGTHYYYKINPVTASVTGRAAYADTVTANNSYVTIYEKIFDDLNDLDFVNNIALDQDGTGINHIRFTSSDNTLGKNLNYSPGNHLRITVGGYRNAAANDAVHNPLIVSISGVDHVINPDSTNYTDYVFDIPSVGSGTPSYALKGQDHIYAFVRSVKLEVRNQ